MPLRYIFTVVKKSLHKYCTRKRNKKFGAQEEIKYIKD